jgi:hypothetical protein
MNFQELYRKIEALDRPVSEEPNEGNLFTGNLAAARAAGKDQADLDGDGDMEKVREDDVEECGMMPSMSSSQPDNVNVSVNMNGSGKGGIRDLLDILRNLEDGGDDEGHLGSLIGKMDKEPIIGSDMPVDEFANEPEPQTAPMSRMVATGNDLLSKGAEAPKVNGGGNPRGTPPMESLVARLESLYQEVKGR